MLERFLLKQREFDILVGNSVNKDDAFIFKVFLADLGAESTQNVFNPEKPSL